MEYGYHVGMLLFYCIKLMYRFQSFRACKYLLTLKSSRALSMESSVNVRHFNSSDIGRRATEFPVNSTWMVQFATERECREYRSPANIKAVLLGCIALSSIEIRPVLRKALASSSILATYTD